MYLRIAVTINITMVYRLTALFTSVISMVRVLCLAISQSTILASFEYQLSSFPARLPRSAA